MKIFDCIIYSNEDLILDIRFNTLNDYIHKFVIIESKYDHQGNKKKLNFNIQKFKKFKKKIIYKIVSTFPKNFNNWERENYQRNYIMKGLNSANDDDYILISDADEIPNLSKLKKPLNKKFTVFEQKIFYYKLNLLNEKDKNWYGSRMCKKKHLKSPQWLRNQKVKKYSIWKFYKINWNIIKNGGWHFSFLMSAVEISKKIKSFAHAEFNQKKFTDIKKINFNIKKGLDIFNREITYKKINLNSSFPEYIINNKKKFKDWIL